jgi:hypothetical protein
MENDFLHYNESLVLKELGYNEPCLGYRSSDNKFGLFASHGKDNVNSKFGYYPTAPLFQQALRWFRTKGFYTTGPDSTIDEGVRTYFYHMIYDENDEVVAGSDEDFSTYELAELACLRKLIEVYTESLTPKKDNDAQSTVQDIE